MRIGIAGFGTVGQALYANLEEPERAVIHDPPKGYLGPLQALVNCDIVFCCLPTPAREDGGQNARLVLDFLAELKDAPRHFGCVPGSPVVAVKSTVLPTVELGPEHGRVVFNPEFLNARNAAADFHEQSVIILGGEADDCRRVAEAYRQEFRWPQRWTDDSGGGPPVIYTSSVRARQVKYVHNAYHALKVLWWNYVQEITGAERDVFDIYAEIVGADEDQEMARICADGLPGYGGACFPKDVAALHAAHPHELTAMMQAYNGRLRPDGTP